MRARVTLAREYFKNNNSFSARAANVELTLVESVNSTNEPKYYEKLAELVSAMLDDIAESLVEFYSICIRKTQRSLILRCLYMRSKDE